MNLCDTLAAWCDLVGQSLARQVLLLEFFRAVVPHLEVVTPRLSSILERRAYRRRAPELPVLAGLLLVRKDIFDPGLIQVQHCNESLADVNVLVHRLVQLLDCVVWERAVQEHPAKVLVHGAVLDCLVDARARWRIDGSVPQN